MASNNPITAVGTFLADGINAIANLAEQASKRQDAKIVEGIAPDDRTKMVQFDGKITPFKILPPPRKHTVQTLDDLITSAKRWQQEFDAENNGVIWIGEHHVVLVPDDEDRRDSITMPLVRTDLWELICTLTRNPIVDQPALIRLLRVQLAAMVGSTELLAKVRLIRFRGSEDSTSNLNHGQESLGRSIEREIVGGGDLPEQLQVYAQPWINGAPDASDSKIRIDFEIRIADKQFSLRPFPDDLQDALTEHKEAIKQHLHEALGDKQTVLFGTP